MQVESWKDNLLFYASKLNPISNKYLISSIIKDKTLLSGVVSFLNSDNLEDVIILYDEYSWVFKSMMIMRHIICSPYLEGKPFNVIEWETLVSSLPSNNITQLSYLILDDTMDTLYEFKLICDQYHINYDLKNLRVKCLVDNRTAEYRKPQALSLESRSGLTVNSVITLPI